MTIGNRPAPKFSRSVRGYDHVQVDEYIASLRAYAAQVGERAAAAEAALVECRRELASPGSGGVSERLAAILQLANEEAEEIRARALAEAEAVTQNASRDAEITINTATEQREAVQREIDQLVEIRDDLLQRLTDLAGVIADATQRLEAPPETTASSTHVDVELFDAEALERDDGADTEGTADVEADTEAVSSTGQPPEE